MSAEIYPFPLQKPGPYRFTYTVIMQSGQRISGKSTHEISADLVEALLDQFPDASRISVIKENL